MLLQHLFIDSMEPPLTEKQTCLVSTKTKLNASAPNFDHMIPLTHFSFHLPQHPRLVNFIPATLTEIHPKKSASESKQCSLDSIPTCLLLVPLLQWIWSNHHKSWIGIVYFFTHRKHIIISWVFLRSYRMLMPLVAGEWHASCHVYRTGLRTYGWEAFCRIEIDGDSSTPRQLWNSIDAMTGRGLLVDLRPSVRQSSTDSSTRGRPGYVRPPTMLRRCCHIGQSPAKASEL